MLDITNEHLHLSLDPATAVCKSLQVDGAELTRDPRPLFTIDCVNPNESYRAAVVFKILNQPDAYQICFKGCSLTVTLKIKPEHDWFIYEVLAASEEIDKFYVLNPATNYDRENTFAAALPIKLSVNCDRDDNIVFSQSVGILGEAAFIVGKRGQMSNILKKFQQAKLQCSSSVGGAYAADYPPNHENYLFVQHPTLDDMGQWIKLCHDLGIGKVYLERAFRHGDFEPLKEFYPQGIDDLKQVVAKFKKEGIHVALESLSHFVAIDSPLAKRTDELARLDNGQFMRWGESYIPKPDSQLFLEVADNLAAFYKDLELNGGIYFDAIDLVSRFPDANYYAGLFVRRFMKSIPGCCPAGMSTDFGSFFPYRSHYAPYDYPKADFDGFVAKHAEDIQTYGLTMVLDMGWIALDVPAAPTVKQLEDYLALCNKISAIYGILDLSPASIQKPEVKKLAELLQIYNKTAAGGELIGRGPPARLGRARRAGRRRRAR